MVLNVSLLNWSIRRKVVYQPVAAAAVAVVVAVVALPASLGRPLRAGPHGGTCGRDGACDPCMLFPE